ncbi:MAG: hypothetical protein HY795_06675 [Desulfovibrio sp.]|nr:hypothetical protein [Desulfovibrio sp.]MBI4961216.1 hypothetical protein [Desulfovibrio sp.]
MECNFCADHITPEEQGVHTLDLRYYWCPALGTVVFPEFDLFCCLARRAGSIQDEPTQH